MTRSSSRRFARVRRSAFVGLIAAVSPLLLLASPVAAANNIIITAMYGDCGFYGENAGAGKNIRIEWYDADGNLKSKHRVTSTSTGEFLTNCEVSEIVESGDVLRTQIGTNIANLRTFTVPKLTANVDRVLNTVSGKVSTEGLDTLRIDVAAYNGGFSFDNGTLHTALPDVVMDDGVNPYSTTLWDANPDIQGWDEFQALWIGVRGDTFVRYGYAEGMEFWSRQTFLRMAGNPGTLVSVKLNATPGGVLRSEIDGRVNAFGSLFGTFADSDGDNARIAPGNEVEANFASDATLLVPSMSVTFNKTTDRVVVDCNIVETGQTGVYIQVYSSVSSKYGERVGLQNNDSGATFTANFATGGAVNLVSGDKVDVRCKYPTGDVVARTYTIP